MRMFSDLIRRVLTLGLICGEATVVATFLVERILLCLNARAGRATWRELTTAIGLANATQDVACKMLRSLLQARQDISEIEPGVWQFAGTAPTAVTPLRALIGAVASPHRLKSSGPALHHARFLALHVVSEQQRRGRAVIAAAQPVSAMRGNRPVLFQLANRHQSRFIPNLADLRQLEEFLRSDDLVVVLSARKVLYPLSLTFTAAGLAFPPLMVLELEGLLAGLSRTRGGRLSALPPLPEPANDDDPATVVLQIGNCFLATIEAAVEQGIEDVVSLLRVQESARATVSFETRRFDRAFVEELPTASGVYWFLNRAGAVLYVGKARNLRERVSSYFANGAPEELKLHSLLSEAYDLQYRVTGSELEAILEEHDRIKTCNPPLNTQVEVHERRSLYGRGRDLILFFSAADPAFVDVYLVSSRAGRKTARVKRGRRIPRALSTRIRSLFFTAKRALREPSEELELIYSWFAANRDTISFIDVARTAGLADCLRLVGNYVACDDTGYRKTEFR